MKDTQKKFVIDQLKRNGYITRNQCLKNYISRLGAIICDLKKEGWEFKAGNDNGDYKYTLVKKIELYQENKIEVTDYSKNDPIPIGNPVLEREIKEQTQLFNIPRKKHYEY